MITFQANGFWVSVQLAGIATLGSMLLTPAAAYAFHFLKFPFRRTLLIIIINAFVLPQQVVVIPLFTLWRQMGLIDNLLSVLIPYIGLSFAWSMMVTSFAAGPAANALTARLQATMNHLQLRQNKSGPAYQGPYAVRVAADESRLVAVEAAIAGEALRRGREGHHYAQTEQGAKSYRKTFTSGRHDRFLLTLLCYPLRRSPNHG